MYQQPMYQQAPPKRNNHAMRNGLLGAGAGMVGGFLLADAMQPDVIIENNYEGGYDGGDFGGGDFGGDF